MSASSKEKIVERKLDALSSLGNDLDRATLNEKLKEGLADSHFRVVAKAATICGERLLHERIGDLKAAYARFLEDPIKRDPKCIAKQSIARALVSLECPDVDFFRTGIQYRQLEPVWGGTEDCALDIRSSCAMGLIASGHYRAMAEVIHLLADPQGRVREGAVRALSCGNPQTAEVLLRFKVMVGDAEPEVIGECFIGLMSIASDESLHFVAAGLSHSKEAIRDLAALALGQSRHPGAIAHLRAAWDGTVVSREFRKVLIRAAAVHRSEDAFEWLLSIIEHGEQVYADTAVDALSVYERNSKLVERIKTALTNRKQQHHTQR
jgi:hypothetical protein